MPTARDSLLIPTVDSRLFSDGHHAARLAVGVLAVGDTVMPGLQDEYAAYALLRGAVYLQEGFTTQEQLNSDGSETDLDDRRSVHFGVVENDRGSGRQRVIGAMRLIVKRSTEDAPLPLEHHFPEAFQEGAASPSSAEVSRLIARHEDGAVAGFCKWPLFAAGLIYATTNGFGPIYGVVTERLQRVLCRVGVPVSALAPAKYVAEINARKMPITVDTDGLRDSITGDVSRSLVFSHLKSTRVDEFVYISADDVPPRKK